MSENECDRIKALEIHADLSKSRVKRLWVEVDKMQGKQDEILALLLKVKYFSSGAVALLVLDQVGIIAVVRSVLLPG